MSNFVTDNWLTILIPLIIIGIIFIGAVIMAMNQPEPVIIHINGEIIDIWYNLVGEKHCIITTDHGRFDEYMCKSTFIIGDKVEFDLKDNRRILNMTLTE
jgi:hypothetical protein